MRTLDSDLGVYVVSGAFALAVYLVAIAVLVFATGIPVTLRTTATLTGGFLLFVGSYAVAMVVYRGVQSGDPEADG